MHEKFNPEKYEMTVCPICEGCGRISFSDDAQVFQHCGGFGFLRKQGKTFGQKGNRISATASGGTVGLPEHKK